MRKRYRRSLVLKRIVLSKKGQTLVEVPIVMLVTCLIVVLLVQMGIWFRTHMMVKHAAIVLARISVCDGIAGTGPQVALLEAYAADKLSALGAGDMWCIPGSFKVTTSGSANSHEVKVTLSLRQKTIPLVVVMSAGAVQAAYTVSSTATLTGTRLKVDGTPQDAPIVFGKP